MQATAWGAVSMKNAVRGIGLLLSRRDGVRKGHCKLQRRSGGLAACVFAQPGGVCSSRCWAVISVWILAVLGLVPVRGWAQLRPSTIIVSAEGLADPNFYKDQTLAYDEALRDAKRQAVEKAVGCFVSSQSIVENYTLVRDRVISKSDGIIKNVLKIVNGGVVWIKAEVLAKPLRDSLRQLSRMERMQFIREQGNPTFAVNMTVRSPESPGRKLECDVCIAEVQNRLKRFGYKVIDEDEAVKVREERIKLMLTRGFSQEIASVFVKHPGDISVEGSIKLKKSPIVHIGGVEVQTTLLTAWALQAVDNHTSEVIFSENFRPPQGTAYNDEDEAIMEVGRKVGNLFSQDIFKDYLMRPTHDILLTIVGLKDRQTAKMMKKEFLGLRSVLNVTFREFLAGGEAVFEIEFAGNRESFADILDQVILAAFNAKYGANTFAIQEEHGDLVRIVVNNDNVVTSQAIDEGAPVQLAGGVPQERIKEVIKSPELKDKYEKLMDL